jgi:hypothetical protein
MSNLNSLPQNLRGTIAALRATIAHFDESQDFASSDPALVTLKSLLLTRIAELEALQPSAAAASYADESCATLPEIDPPAPSLPE